MHDFSGQPGQAEGMFGGKQPSWYMAAEMSIVNGGWPWEIKHSQQ
jgi:hypothetical protein